MPPHIQPADGAGCPHLREQPNPYHVCRVDAGKVELDGAQYLGFRLPFTISQLSVIEAILVGGAEVYRNRARGLETRIYPGMPRPHASSCGWHVQQGVAGRRGSASALSSTPFCRLHVSICGWRAQSGVAGRRGSAFALSRTPFWRRWSAGLVTHVAPHGARCAGS